MKRRQFCAAALAGGALLLAPALRAGEGQRLVTYYGDRQLRLPARISRIATTWEAQNSIIAMLGHGSQIVATTRIVRDMPVFRRFVPSIAQAALASGGSAGDVNVEELLRLKPEVLFVAGDLPPAKKAQLERQGIAVAELRYNSLAALVERTLISGEILGSGAWQKARDYRDYFEANKTRVRVALAGIPPERRLRLYHAVGDPLSTSGRPSLNQDWMDLGGAINVAEHWFERKAPVGQVSLEQIIIADPDVIVAMRSGDAAQIRRDPRWAGLRAVRQGRVYANPRGMFWWCRETSEQALQFLWLAKTLYPQALARINMREETQAFYQRFYGYTLSDAEADEFLEPRS